MIKQTQQYEGNSSKGSSLEEAKSASVTKIALKREREEIRETNPMTEYYQGFIPNHVRSSIRALKDDDLAHDAAEGF